MMKPCLRVNIELSQPLEDIENLESYRSLWGLVLWTGTALGEIELPVEQGICTAVQQFQAIADQLSHEFLSRCLAKALTAGQWRAGMDWSDLLALVPQPSVWDCPGSHGSHDDFRNGSHAGSKGAVVTVAICRAAAPSSFAPEQLQACLSTLQVAAQAPGVGAVELLLVGFAESELPPLGTDAQNQPGLTIKQLLTRPLTESLTGELTEQYHQAVEQSQGELIAFLSPQIQVGPNWLQAIFLNIAPDEKIAIAAGPCLGSGPIEAPEETLRAQRLAYPNFQRWWHRQSRDGSDRRWHVHYGYQLTHHNWVIRRSALQAQTQPFSWQPPHRLVFEQLSQRQTLCLEPELWTRDSTTPSTEQLKAQAHDDAKGLARYFAWGWLTPEAAPRCYRPVFLKESLGILRWYGQSALSRKGLDQDLFKAKWSGAWAGLGEWVEQRGWVGTTQQAIAALLPLLSSSKLKPDDPRQPRLLTRTIDLDQPLPFWKDLSDYDAVRLFVMAGGKYIDQLDVWHKGGNLSPQQLGQEIVNGLGDRLFSHAPQGQTQSWADLQQQMQAWLKPPIPEVPVELPEPKPQKLPVDVPVSVIITTCDRPDDLRNCLRHLLAQESDREFEIIVADNRPASGITPAVVNEFLGVKYIAEPRVGGSYGRNTAFCASQGEIIMTVDDDITVPPTWLETILAPMARPEVMAVTGNVFPRELETPAQQWYEHFYRGLSQGPEPFEADGNWLASFSYPPPVWDLGVSANAAFRACIFANPEIGLMPEVLGPGTPTDGGEESYLIYRILKAGGTVVYNPSAYAWHRHRRTVPELRRQVFGHYKGGVAYHIHIWLVDGDLRGRQHLFSNLPTYLRQRFVERLQGKNQVPWRFLAMEILGSMAAPWGYWRSSRAVARKGYSEPYIPVDQRVKVKAEPELEPETNLAIASKP